MVTKTAAVLLSLFWIAATCALAAAQVSAPAPNQPGTGVAPATPPPAGGDEAAQRTIFGPTHRVTLVLGAILVVVALGLIVAGMRRGPRAADPAARRGEQPVTRRRNDRVA